MEYGIWNSKVRWNNTMDEKEDLEEEENCKFVTAEP